MGKYDDAIGGGKIIVDVEEILNEEAADKVDKKIKTQKAELEKPIKVTVEIDDKSIGKLKQLTEAVKKNSDNLQQAIQSGRNISELSDYIQTHKQLERQIKAVTKRVKSNNTEVSKSKQVLIDAQNIIDQISISIEKNNRIDYLDKTVKGATQAVSAISKFQQLLGDLEKKYGEATFSSIFGGVVSSFKAIDESNASQVYDALIVKDREYQSQLEEESKVRERITQEVKAYAEATKYIYKNGEPSQDILNAYASYWEKVSAGAMSAADAVKAFEEEWNQLGGAVDYQQKQQIDEIRSLIRNQKEWLKYLEQSLNSDNFKTSGKKEATQKLRDLTSRLIYARKNNYQDDAGNQYNRQMIEVAWAQGYKEAQRQNVAQSTLTRYYTDALGSYDDNLRVLQEQYAFRQKLLAQYEEELEKIGQVTSEMKEQKEAKNDIVPSSQAITSMSQLGEVLDAVRVKYRELKGEMSDASFKMLEAHVSRAKTALEELNDVAVLSKLRESIDKAVNIKAWYDLLRIPQTIQKGFSNIDDFDQTVEDQFRISIEGVPYASEWDIAFLKTLERIGIQETKGEKMPVFGTRASRLMTLFTEEDKKTLGFTDRNLLATKGDLDDDVRRALEGFSINYPSAVHTEFNADLDSVTVYMQGISELITKLTKLNEVYPAAQKRHDEFLDALHAEGAIGSIATLEQLQAVVDQFPEAQQYIDKIQSRIQKPVVQQPIETTPAPIQEETKAIKDNTQATEENIKTKKKSSQIKLREFTKEEYDTHDVEAVEDTVDIIRNASRFGTQFAADMTTSCKKAETAVKRLFSAIDPEKYPALASWKEAILESVQDGYFSQVDTYNGMYLGGYSWGVEALDEDRFYVYINLLDIAKDKESEYAAYQQEEMRKRDEGIRKESNLLNELYTKYDAIAKLRKPEWNRDNVIGSYQSLLDYYEQEKVLLQDILNLENEISKIPGQYKTGTDFRFVRSQKVGQRRIENSEYNIDYYSKELREAQNELDAKEVKPQTVRTGVNTEPTQLELFNKEYPEFVKSVYELEPSGELYSKLQQRIQVTRSRVEQGLLDACDAYAVIMEEMAQIYAGMTPPAPKMRKMSMQEYSKFMNGIDLNKLFSDWGIDKENQGTIRDAFARLGDVIVSKGNASRSDADIQAQIDNISNLVLQYAQEPKGIAEHDLGWVLDELSGKIFYDEQDVNSIGKEQFNALKSQIKGKLSLTKTNDAKNLPIDVFFNSLSENIQSLIIDTWEKENGSTFNYSQASILEGIASVYQSAQRNVQQAGKPIFDKLISPEAIESVRNTTNTLIDTTIGNAEQLLRTEQQITGAIEDQNQVRTESNEQQRKTIQDVGDTSKNERPSIIERDEARALEVLRNAKNNKTNLVDLSGVYSTDDLKSQLESMASTVTSKENLLSVGSVHIQDGIASVTMYNEALGITYKQLYEVSKAAEDAEESQLKLWSESYDENYKAAQKYSEAQKKKIAKDDSWLIGQASKLNTQERKYKYAKKIEGTTALTDADETSLAEGADKTIDSLTQHIKNKILVSMGQGLTDEVKNQITNDLRILDNEIKVEQYKQYASTTMKPSELKSAKDELEYTLQSLEAKAKKNNVFSQIEQDVISLRSQLKGVADGTQLSKFIDDLRVTKSKLNAEIAKEQTTKKEEQNYQNLINLQNRLYEAKKKLNDLEIKGQSDTAEGQQASRKVQELQDQYDLSVKLLQNEEHRRAIEDRGTDLDSQLNTAKDQKQIEQYYQNIFDTVQRINNLDSQINTLKMKDGGKGIYSDLIASLENEKATLLGKINQIGADVNQYFNGVFASVGDVEKVQLPFNSLLKDTSAYNTILDFLNSVDVRATLGAEAVNKLVQAFYNSSQAGSEFVGKISAQFKPAEEAFARLQQIISSGGLNVDNDGTYQQMKQRFDALQQLSQTDMSKWSAEDIAYFTNLAKSVVEYANNLSKAAEQEANYFAGKTKAYAGDTMYGNPQKNELMVIDQPDKNIDTARQKLEQYVAAFTEGKGIITDFTTAANGISQISFSALDEGTGQFRTFTAEMGRCTDNIYRTETTLNGLASGTNAAKKSIAALATVMSQLNGVSGAEEQLKALWEVYQNLQNAINNKGNSQNVDDQNTLKNMATDADKARKEVERLIKEWAKAQAGLDDGRLTPLKSIDKNGNIKEQMWERIQASADGARASFVDFDEKTNTLTYALTNADKTVTTMTAHMYGLNGAITVQQGKTEKLKTGWQEFTGALGGVTKGIGQYLSRAFSVWAIVGQIKKGFNAVKQIDAALTELKKVTDETEGSYQRFLNTASQTAGKIGSTVSDFTQASANFARLGYTMEESAKMAETAIVYKNVADGLDTVEESTESIISTMKAFGVESDDTMSIIDKFNEVKVTCLLIQ